MRCTMRVNFTKMHGLGNDFIVLDARAETLPEMTPPIAAALALTFAFGAVEAQDASRAVTDGGVKIEGWMGKIDAGEAANGLTLENARLAWFRGWRTDLP